MILNIRNKLISKFISSFQLAQKLVATQESKQDTGLALKEMLEEECLALIFLIPGWNLFPVTLALVL